MTGRFTASQILPKAPTFFFLRLWHPLTYTPCYPHPQQDLQAGLAVQPMLASTGGSVEDVYRRMRGKPFVVEIKFDGERMLVRAGLGGGG